MASDSGSVAVLNLRDPEIRANPYPTYSRLREERPVFHYEPVDVWFLGRYDDVSAAYRNPRVFSSQTIGGRLGSYAASDDADVRTVAEMLIRAFLFTDPPSHTRLRSLINRAFTLKAVERMRPRVQELTRQLLDEARDVGGSFDFIASFAAPLPLYVIAEMLGIPNEDQKQFKFWSDEAFKVIDPGLKEDDRLASFRHTADLADYLTDAAARRTADAEGDLLSALVAASHAEQGDLTPDELVSMVLVLLTAGNETTTSLLGHSLNVLLGTEQQVAALAVDDALIRTSLEEVLRCEPPLQFSSRVVTEDVELHGCRIPAGSLVALLIAAANRDPRHFDRPDTFNAGRSPNQHLTFGSGIHFCLGAPLARMEAQVAIRTIAREYPELRAVPGDGHINQNLLARGFTSLPAFFDG